MGIRVRVGVCEGGGGGGRVAYMDQVGGGG